MPLPFFSFCAANCNKSFNSRSSMQAIYPRSSRCLLFSSSIKIFRTALTRSAQKIRWTCPSKCFFFPNNGIKNCNDDKIPTNKILKLAKLVISVRPHLKRLRNLWRHIVFIMLCQNCLSFEINLIFLWKVFI